MEGVEARARSVAFSLARLHSTGLLINHALATENDLDFEVAKRAAAMTQTGELFCIAPKLLPIAEY